MSIFDYKNNFEAIESIPCHLEWEHKDAPQHPEVSVIMPIYINHYYFRLALESALNQDWEGIYEIVVVDNDTDPDNPNKKIIEEFNDPRVRYFRNSENIGMVGNWNRGIMKARGQFVTFLHDDDLFMPSTISKAMAVANNNSGKGVITTLRIIDDKGNKIGSDKEYELNRRMLIFRPRAVANISLARVLCMNLGNLVGAIFEREKLIQIGGFRIDSYPVCDYDLGVRYTYKYGCVIMREPSAYYRIAEKNTSYNVYSTIALKRREIMYDIIDNIFLPKWITRRVTETYYKGFDTNWRRQFAPNEHHIRHYVSKFDSRITTIYKNVINLIEAYHISL